MCLVLLSSVLFQYCREPENNPIPASPKNTLVLCEGNFLRSNADVSLFDGDNRTIQNNAFFRKNNRPPGDVLQSAVLQGSTLYMVMNNSNKIEVVNADDFSSIRSIEGFSLPRYIAVSGNTAFVTEWVSFSGNGRVAVVNLTTGTIRKTLPVGKFPERVLLVNSLLFVANSDDSTVSVISTVTEEVVNTLSVGAGPNGFVFANNKLIVLCGGFVRFKPDFSGLDSAACVAGDLVEITPTANPSVVRRSSFTDRFRSVSRLTGYSNRLYYTYNNAVYSTTLDSLSSTTSPFITRSGSDATVPVYGLAIDPSTGIVYVAFSNFISANRFNRYRTDGTFLDSYNTSEGPNGFLFR
jgi:YVTN family beta-propeller protein